MTYIFDPIPQPAVPVVGETRLFPVRRIFCVGRNYRAHVQEMGHNPDRDPPFFFSKPADALVPNGAIVEYPTLTENLHHEIELVVAIGRPGFKVPVAEANSLIYGYAVGIDLTRRDLQMDALKKGLPWDFGKSFDNSAPCSAIHPIAKTGVMTKGRIWLRVNGNTRQDADIADLIWSVPELLSTLSHGVELQPGDLVYTGTPAGVGAMVPGDKVIGGIDDLGEIETTIAPPR